MALLFQGQLGAANFYQIPVLGLGQHKHYRNQTLWLRLDLPELMQANINNASEKTSFLIFRKKSGETPILLAPRERHKKYLTAERLEIVNENLEFLDLLGLRYPISYPCTLNINELYLDGSLSVLNYILEVDTLFIRNCDCREISKFPRIHNLTYDRCTNLVIPENVTILNIYEYKTDNVLDLSRCSQLEELDLMEVEAMAFYIPQHIKTLRIENVKPVIDIDNILSNFPYLEILEYDGHIEVMS